MDRRRLRPRRPGGGPGFEKRRNPPPGQRPLRGRGADPLRNEAPPDPRAAGENPAGGEAGPPGGPLRLRRLRRRPPGPAQPLRLRAGPALLYGKALRKGVLHRLSGHGGPGPALCVRAGRGEDLRRLPDDENRPGTGRGGPDSHRRPGGQYFPHRPGEGDRTGQRGLYHEVQLRRVHCKGKGALRPVRREDHPAGGPGLGGGRPAAGGVPGRRPGGHCRRGHRRRNRRHLPGGHFERKNRVRQRPHGRL